jgi:hypothetical protein
MSLCPNERATKLTGITFGAIAPAAAIFAAIRLASSRTSSFAVDFPAMIPNPG